MEKKILEQIIANQREEIDIFLKQKFIQRDLYTIIPDILPDIVTVISGVRRCGKSILAHQLLAGKVYGYINFDDERLVNLTTADLNDVFEALQMVVPGLQYLLLDEIQNIAGWELFVNRLLRRGLRIVVTGSNAHLLSRELATHLTGRHASFELYPFSFREFLRYRNCDINFTAVLTTGQRVQVKQLFQEYMSGGGFPQVVTTALAQPYLRDVYHDIISRDIVVRHHVRRTNDLRELALYVLSHFGSRITYTQLQQAFNIRSMHTVQQYLQYCAEAYLSFQLQPFSFKPKQRIRGPRKIYGIDCGMINALITQHSPNNGHLLENIVYIELLRRRSNTFFYVTKAGQEVDFVIQTDRKITKIIQVCYQLDDVETYEREVKALLTASAELHSNDLLIITADTESERVVQGKTIQLIPIWKWLLGHYSN